MEKQEVKPEITMVERAENAAKALQAANAESNKLLERAERLKAQEILGGSTNAGQVAPVISDAEKIKLGAQNYFKGTVIEGMIK